MSIKSFLYLDRYRMYSISSQIFEGLTEYIMDYSRETKTDEEEQKGPIGSGRILADILSKEAGIEEKRFLHDYAYTLFEEHLEKEGKILTIDENSITESLPKLQEFNFIKVAGKLIFNDINVINRTLNDFEKIGRALTYVTNNKNYSEEILQIERQVNDAVKNQKQGVRNKLEPTLQKKIEDDYLNSGLFQDPQFMKYLAYLFDFGYQDQLEVQIILTNIETGEGSSEYQQLFSANLNRDNLTEDESLILRKYGRFTEQEFVILGTITQSGEPTAEQMENDESDKNLKQALMNMLAGISNVESSFTSRIENELIIDPISVYREL